MLDLSQSMLAVMVIALAAFGIGRTLLRILKWPDKDVLDITVWSLAIGLLAAGAGLLCLALGGWLSETSVLFLSLGGVLGGLVELACLAAGRRRSIRMETGWLAGRDSLANHRVESLAAAVAATVLGATFVRALAPPLDSDVLSRSLAVPKELLLSHGERLSETNIPNLSQFWSLWALALDGPVAANLLHWGLGVLTLLAIVLLARPLLGRRLGWMAGGTAMIVPAIQHELGVPLEGISLAFVVALALAAAQRTLMEFEQRRAALAAGLMAGAATAIDPAGLLFATALLVAAAHAVLGKRPVAVELRGELLRMMLAMLAIVLPWAACGGLMTPGRGPLISLTSLGPVFAIAAGGLIFARRLRGLPWHLLVLLVYVAGALALGSGGAAWAPLVPLGGILVVWTWHEMQRLPTGLRSSVAGLVLAIVAVDLAELVRTVAPCLGVALGCQTREAFLLDHEGSYRAAALLGAISHPEQRLLLVDANSLYFPCSTHRRDPALNRAKPESRERLFLEEAHRAGASFVLLAEPARTTDEANSPADSTAMLAWPLPAESEIFAPSREVIPILEYRFADDNNRCIRYRLWKLHGPQAGPDAQPPVAPAAGGGRIGQLPRPATR
jgi:hypothetical protein